MKREQATVEAGAVEDDGRVVLARADGRRVVASLEAVRRGGWRHLRPGQRVVLVTDPSGRIAAVEPMPGTATDRP